MKKIIEKTIDIYYVCFTVFMLALTGCSRDSNAVLGNEVLLTKASGWKPIAITQDYTNNGTDDGADSFKPCHTDNYAYFYANGIGKGFEGLIQCPSAYTGDTEYKWWWDNTTSNPNSAFYTKNLTYVTGTRYDTIYNNILKLTNDTFRISIINPSVTIPGLGPTRWHKAIITMIPR